MSLIYGCFPGANAHTLFATALILLHLHLIWGMNYGPIQLIREDRCCSHFLRRATKADLARISRAEWYFLAPRQQGGNFLAHGVIRTTPAAVRCTRLFENNTRPGWKKDAGHFLLFSWAAVGATSRRGARSFSQKILGAVFLYFLRLWSDRFKEASRACLLKCHKSRGKIKLRR